MFENLEEEIEIKADEYALEESTACNYGEASRHVYQGYFYGFQKGAEFGYNKANKELQKAKQIIQEFLDLNYSEFTKTNAVFLHADKFLKESK